ncbi:Uncharacterised protein [Yersinia frederiksenii]|nr:Uncharacterised protein [Yersinia frederiksenii]
MKKIQPLYVTKFLLSKRYEYDYSLLAVHKLALAASVKLYSYTVE